MRAFAQKWIAAIEGTGHQSRAFGGRKQSDVRKIAPKGRQRAQAAKVAPLAAENNPMSAKSPQAILPIN